MKSITVLVMSVVLLFSGALFSSAQVFRGWNEDKDKAFKMAKEQDKFIIMAAGHSGCGHCQTYSDILGYNDNGRIVSVEKGGKGPLKYFVDENYITWFSDRSGGYKDNVLEYIDEILESNPAFLPLIGIINPDEPGRNFAFISGTGEDFNYPKTIEKTTNFLKINLLSSSELEWYKNKNEVFSKAKAQNKYVFKLIGKGTSPNSHKVMKLLNETPFKQLLEETYILWYSDDVQEVKTLAGDNEMKSLPYISIIYPEAPDDLLEETWGIQEDEALENMLKAYTVSNENILPNQTKVAVWGNTLLISSQISNEQITVYSLTGQNVTSVYKNDFTVSIDASKFPKGVLIIRSSAGWTSKILIF